MSNYSRPFRRALLPTGTSLLIRTANTASSLTHTASSRASAPGVPHRSGHAQAGEGARDFSGCEWTGLARGSGSAPLSRAEARSASLACAALARQTTPTQRHSRSPPLLPRSRKAWCRPGICHQHSSCSCGCSTAKLERGPTRFGTQLDSHCSFEGCHHRAPATRCRHLLGRRRSVRRSNARRSCLTTDSPCPQPPHDQGTSLATARCLRTVDAQTSLTAALDHLLERRRCEPVPPERGWHLRSATTA